MAQQLTLALVKPHYFMRHMQEPGIVLNSYRNAGLELADDRLFMFTREQVKAFYAEHRDKPFFPGIVEEMTSFSCRAFILGGDEAVAQVRRVNGATDPRKADPDSIRGRLSQLFDPSRSAANFVHGSDSEEAAFREIALVFGDNYFIG
jgi:nucleoside-diphosphate kinase